MSELWFSSRAAEFAEREHRKLRFRRAETVSQLGVPVLEHLRRRRSPPAPKAPRSFLRAARRPRLRAVRSGASRALSTCAESRKFCALMLSLARRRSASIRPRPRVIGADVRMAAARPGCEDRARAARRRCSRRKSDAAAAASPSGNCSIVAAEIFFFRAAIDLASEVSVRSTWPGSSVPAAFALIQLLSSLIAELLTRGGDARNRCFARMAVRAGVRLSRRASRALARGCGVRCESGFASLRAKSSRAADRLPRQ